MTTEHDEVGRAVSVLVRCNIPVRQPHWERLIEDGIRRGLPDDLMIRKLTERTDQMQDPIGVRIHRLMKSRDLLGWAPDGRVVAPDPRVVPTLGGVAEARRRVRAYRIFAEPGKAKAAREEAGLTVEQVVKELEKRPETIRKWELGDDCPGPVLAVRYVELIEAAMERR